MPRGVKMPKVDWGKVTITEVDQTSGKPMEKALTPLGKNNPRVKLADVGKGGDTQTPEERAQEGYLFARDAIAYAKQNQSFNITNNISRVTQPFVVDTKTVIDVESARTIKLNAFLYFGKVDYSIVNAALNAWDQRIPGNDIVGILNKNIQKVTARNAVLKVDEATAEITLYVNETGNVEIKVQYTNLKMQQFVSTGVIFVDIPDAFEYTVEFVDGEYLLSPIECSENLKKLFEGEMTKEEFQQAYAATPATTNIKQPSASTKFSSNLNPAKFFTTEQLEQGKFEQLNEKYKAAKGTELQFLQYAMRKLDSDPSPEAKNYRAAVEEQFNKNQPSYFDTLINDLINLGNQIGNFIAAPFIAFANFIKEGAKATQNLARYGQAEMPPDLAAKPATIEPTNSSEHNLQDVLQKVVARGIEFPDHNILPLVMQMQIQEQNLFAAKILATMIDDYKIKEKAGTLNKFDIEIYKEKFLATGVTKKEIEDGWQPIEDAFKQFKAKSSPDNKLQQKANAARAKAERLNKEEFTEQELQLIEQASKALHNEKHKISQAECSTQIKEYLKKSSEQNAVNAEKELADFKEKAQSIESNKPNENFQSQQNEILLPAMNVKQVTIENQKPATDVTTPATVISQINAADDIDDKKSIIAAVCKNAREETQPENIKKQIREYREIANLQPENQAIPNGIADGLTRILERRNAQTATSKPTINIHDINNRHPETTNMPAPTREANTSDNPSNVDKEEVNRGRRSSIKIN